MGTSFDSESEDLREKLKEKERSLGIKDGQLVAKEREINNLKSDLQKMTVRANQAERKFLELQGKVLVTLATIQGSIWGEWGGGSFSHKITVGITE